MGIGRDVVGLTYSKRLDITYSKRLDIKDFHMNTYIHIYVYRCMRI